MPPELLADAVRGARAMGWVGFNCSLPHKVAVIDHLDGLGESAALIGAVNTVVRRGDELVGENTDGRGFVAAVRTVVEPAGATVVNRGRDRAEPLVELLKGRTKTKAEFTPWPKAFRVPKDADIVINATSIGLYPDIDGRLDLDVDSLAPSMVAADLIPNPPHTLFLRGAAERGCRTLDGLGMLVNQGVIGIKYWTGVDADPTVMRAELASVLGV